MFIKKSLNIKGAAKEMLVTVTNMMATADNELAQETRRKLANLMA